MKIAALIMFIVMYALMIAWQSKRMYVALVTAAIFVIVGIMPISKVAGEINWNILLMLAGTMGTVSLFIESKMPNRMADIILKKMPDIKWAIIAMSVFAGIVSAFIDNVATVLMIAPVGLAIAKKLNISPVAMLISISVSSNLQGAATLVGDTTSILLGGYADMDFIDFFFMNGKPGIFWAVELGAVATVFVMMFLFRKEKGNIETTEMTVVRDYVPSILLVLNVVLLIVASFIENKPEITNGIICMAIFVIALLYSILKNKNFDCVKNAVKEIDYVTLLLLAGLFVVIGGITEVGIIDDISKIIVNIGGDNLFILYTVIVWASVLFSAFIDNIPYVATMLPVIQGIAALIGCSPYVLYFGLLIGATLGGNITPIGASANIATIGILRKEGHTVSLKDFLRIGLPFTLSAVLVGYLFIWFVWA